jgi:hypothetical protein
LLPGGDIPSGSSTAATPLPSLAHTSPVAGPSLPTWIPFGCTSPGGVPSLPSLDPARQQHPAGWRLQPPTSPPPVAPTPLFFSSPARGGFAAQASRAQALVVGPSTLHTPCIFQPNIEGPRAKLGHSGAYLSWTLVACPSPVSCLPRSLARTNARACVHTGGGGSRAGGDRQTEEGRRRGASRGGAAHPRLPPLRPAPMPRARAGSTAAGRRACASATPAQTLELQFTGHCRRPLPPAVQIQAALARSPVDLPCPCTAAPWLV